MRLIFHGELRRLYGVSTDMVVDSVAQAIEGFSRQQPDWPRDMSIVAVGFDSPEKLRQSADEVHLVPAMLGGGGKFVRIAIGTALIIGSFFVGQPLGGLMLTIGISMVLSGVMEFFMKSPKLKKGEDTLASKYIGVNKNTTAVNTPIILAFGQIDLAGHWLSIQSDSTNLSHGNFPANPT